VKDLLGYSRRFLFFLMRWLLWVVVADNVSKLIHLLEILNYPMLLHVLNEASLRLLLGLGYGGILDFEAS
jgi:hypothetical protein